MTEQRSTTLDDTAHLARPLASDDELVADPEFVATLQKRRLTTRATRVLLVLITLGLGFVLGAYVQEHRNPSTATATGLPAGLAELLGGNGGPQAAAGATGGSLTGTVTLVDGNNVYITDAQGNVTKIVTTADTTIKVNKEGTLADLGPSKPVTVQGSQNADGTYAATSIQESSGGGAFPSGGAGFPTGANGGGGPPGGGG